MLNGRLPRAIIFLIVGAQRRIDIFVEQALIDIRKNADDPAYMLTIRQILDRARGIYGARGIELMRGFVIVHAQNELAHIIRAGSAAGRLAAGLNSRQQERYQDANDRNDNE